MHVYDLPHAAQRIAQVVLGAVCAILRDPIYPIQVGIRPVLQHLGQACVQVHRVVGRLAIRCFAQAVPFFSSYLQKTLIKYIAKINKKNSPIAISNFPQNSAPFPLAIEGFDHPCKGPPSPNTHTFCLFMVVIPAIIEITPGNPRNINITVIPFDSCSSRS